MAGLAATSNTKIQKEYDQVVESVLGGPSLDPPEEEKKVVTRRLDPKSKIGRGATQKFGGSAAGTSPMVSPGVSPGRQPAG